MTGTTTVYFYTWGFWAYPFVLLAFFLVVAYLAHKVGYRKGYHQGAHDEQNRSVEPTKFRQRTAESDPRRHAYVRTARIVARRQQKPEPRRGKPADL